MDLIEGGVGRVGDGGAALAGTPMLQSLVVDGIIGGVGAFWSSYPRSWCCSSLSHCWKSPATWPERPSRWTSSSAGGLNGKSFVPLLSSFACAIPGIMATRTISDNKARTITILVAPLMSCSALPVYILLIGAFVEPRFGPGIAGLTLFAMHFVGALLAAPIAFILKSV